MQPREAFFHDCLSWISLSKNKQMAISLSKKVPSGIMAMTLASFIPPADAKRKAATTTAATTTAATTAECFWVVESWKKMGRTTSVDPTNATACCNYVVSSNGTTTTQNSGIPGVTCTSDGIVTKINWWDLGLVHSIPAELGSLKSLTYL
jgi:hypothetical protein